MAIDLSNYEDCATLNKWFQGNYPMGSMRILDKHIEVIKDKDGNRIDELFVATTGVYRDNNDTNPAVMNVARGLQSEYPKHMQRFFAEDVITSSYGRCLALLKATEKTATKDEMKKVVQLQAVPQTFSVDRTEPLPLSNEDWIKAATKTAPKAPLVCCDKGHTLRTGLSKTTQKPYYGYVCLDNIKEHAIWAKQDATGSWYFSEKGE
tara:strand:+ start:398 stop:1018 length:621 start_codon:yes stop_codon:yes gene_type:complete